MGLGWGGWPRILEWEVDEREQSQRAKGQGQTLNCSAKPRSTHLFHEAHLDYPMPPPPTPKPSTT